ncbi:MAG: hypothetical protein ABIJ82_01365 [Patescibacteria group bacterium]
MLHKYLVIVTGSKGYELVKSVHPGSMVTSPLFTEGGTTLAVRITGGEMLNPVLLVETDNDALAPILENQFNTWRLQGLVVGYRRLGIAQLSPEEPITKFRWVVESELSDFEKDSPDVVKTIREWVELLVQGKHDDADLKLRELPKITEMPPSLVASLGEIFGSAVEFHLSVPR